jgi:hypothetical protein
VTSIRRFLADFGTVGAALYLAAGAGSIVVSAVSGQVAASKLPPGEAYALPLIATFAGMAVLVFMWWSTREMSEWDLEGYPYDQAVKSGVGLLLLSAVAFGVFYLLAEAGWNLLTWIGVLVFAILFTLGLARIAQVATLVTRRDRIREKDPELAAALSEIHSWPLEWPTRTPFDQQMGSLALTRAAIDRIHRAGGPIAEVSPTRIPLEQTEFVAARWGNELLVYFWGMTKASEAARVVAEVEGSKPAGIARVIVVPEWSDEVTLQTRKVIEDAGWIVDTSMVMSHAAARADTDRQLAEAGEPRDRERNAVENRDASPSP